MARKPATVSELRAEVRELRRIGAQLANIAYNMGQETTQYELTPETRKIMRQLQKAWDLIPRSERTVAKPWWAEANP